jgi:hypothetical protein
MFSGIQALRGKTGENMFEKQVYPVPLSETPATKHLALTIN